MRLNQALQRIPRLFDMARLREEVARLPITSWLPYPFGGLGTEAVPLVSPGGTANHDYSLIGPAKQTAVLVACPAIEAALRSLGTTISRCRLVRASGSTEAAAEWSYHWFRRAAICIPIELSKLTQLQCGEDSVSLAAGEGWLFDNSRSHKLTGEAQQPHISLVVETTSAEVTALAPSPTLELEPYRFEVLTPQEMAALCDEILSDPAGERLPLTQRHLLSQELTQLQARWEEAFARFGHDSCGELSYQDILFTFRERILPMLAIKRIGGQASCVIDTMLNMSPKIPQRRHFPGTHRLTPASSSTSHPDFERPLFIVSAPRAGSTILFDLVSLFPNVFTIGNESRELFQGIPELHIRARGYASDRLMAAQAQPAVRETLLDSFVRHLVDRKGRRYLDLPEGERPSCVRFVEKTPANSLRIPFLRACFPSALFVYLTRDAKENISSLVEGWRSNRFLAYRDLPGWPHRNWCFLLPPGWQSMVGRPIIEIAALQWYAATTVIEADLRAIPSSSFCEVKYQDLIRSPRQVLRSIERLAGFHWDDAVEQAVCGPLPVSRVTLSAPSSEKWLRHEAELAAILPRLPLLAEQLQRGSVDTVLPSGELRK